MSTRSFPAVPTSIPAARRFAARALPGESRETLEAVSLMVSELATNCIRHAHVSFEVVVRRAGGQIRVEVTDLGAGTPHLMNPSLDQPTGRGLRIVDMLSDDWGVQPGRRSGKTVWFTFDPSASPDAPVEERRSGVLPGSRPAGRDPAPQR